MQSLSFTLSVLALISGVSCSKVEPTAEVELETISLDPDAKGTLVDQLPPPGEITHITLRNRWPAPPGVEAKEYPTSQISGEEVARLFTVFQSTRPAIVRNPLPLHSDATIQTQDGHTWNIWIFYSEDFGFIYCLDEGEGYFASLDAKGGGILELLPKWQSK